MSSEETRREDYAAVFERSFKSARKRVTEGLAKDARDRLDGEWAPISFIRFQPIPSMMLVYVLGIMAVYLGGRFPHMMSAYSLSHLISVIAVAAVIILILGVVWLSHMATSHQTATNRWQRIAEKLIYIYEKEIKRDPADIKKGLNISLHHLNQTLAFVLALVSIIALYSNIEGRIVNVSAPWGDRLLIFFGFSEKLHTAIFTYAFLFGLVSLFYLAYLPHVWRKHLEVVVDQILDERKK
jgi:hypothetical protein